MINSTRTLLLVGAICCWFALNALVIISHYGYPQKKPGDLIYPRYLHAAALLPNGNVLVMGGCWAPPLRSFELADITTWGEDGRTEPLTYYRSCEIYRPATHDWIEAAPTTMDHVFPATALLPKGQVMVIGGYGSSGCELYDPTPGTWTPTTSLPCPRAAGISFLTASGQVFLLTGAESHQQVYVNQSGLANGGLNRLDDALLYDPASRVWTQTAKYNDTLPKRWGIGPIGSAALWLLPEGKLLIAGGSTDAKKCLLYDMNTRRYSPTGDLLADFDLEDAIIALPDGRILLVWNCNYHNETELYDKGVWRSTHSPSRPINKFPAPDFLLLKTGKVLLCGGNDNECELYDPNTGNWSVTGSMKVCRCYNTITMLKDGRVLVTGGLSKSNETLSSCEVYDPTSGEWGAP